MLGSVADISAMFLIVDNINRLLLFVERLPGELSWNEFLVDNKLMKDLKSIPIEENWDFERFIDLRNQYLKWVERRRSKNP